MDLLDLESGDTRRLWESSPPYLEYPVALMEKPCDDEITLDGLSMLISRETPLEPPQVNHHRARRRSHHTNPSTQFRTVLDDEICARTCGLRHSAAAPYPHTEAIHQREVSRNNRLLLEAIHTRLLPRTKR